MKNCKHFSLFNLISWLLNGLRVVESKSNMFQIKNVVRKRLFFGVDDQIEPKMHTIDHPVSENQLYLISYQSDGPMRKTHAKWWSTSTVNLVSALSRRSSDGLKFPEIANVFEITANNGFVHRIKAKEGSWHRSNHFNRKGFRFDIFWKY